MFLYDLGDLWDGIFVDTLGALWTAIVSDLFLVLIQDGLQSIANWLFGEQATYIFPMVITLLVGIMLYVAIGRGLKSRSR